MKKNLRHLQHTLTPKVRPNEIIIDVLVIRAISLTLHSKSADSGEKSSDIVTRCAKYVLNDALLQNYHENYFHDGGRIFFIHTRACAVVWVCIEV